MGTKVSVIIPVYNAEKYLRECLESVVNQTLKEIEIICVDDGSTDGSLAILHEYEAKDRRVRILTQKNQYAGIARNHGMKIAQGEYFAFWDSDDLFELNALEEMYRHAIKTEADICLCGSDRFDTVSMQRESMPWMLNLKDVKQEPFCARDVNSIFQVTAPAPWSKLFSAAFIRLHDLHFQDTVRINDMYFVYSALALAEKIVYIDKAFIHYRSGQTVNLQSGVTKTPDICCTVHRAICSRLKDESIWNDVKASFYQCVMKNLAYNFKLVENSPGSKQRLLETIDNGYFDYLGFEYDDIKALKNKQDFNKVYDELLTRRAEKPGIPAVSVVIAFHNNSEYISRCIESVRSQTLKEIEIICVDDGSTDNSLDILRSFEACEPRIKLIAKEKNCGTLLARKDGALASSGRYIMFLDSDDYLAPDACRTMFEESCKRGADILQISIGVEDYANDLTAKTWLENYLKAQDITCTRREMQEHFYLNRDISTSVVGKLYYAPKCKLAYYNIPDIFCIIGEDIFQQFFFSFFSESFHGVATKPLYWYRRGLGDSNSSVMSVQKFKKYCNMALLYKHMQIFATDNKADTITKSAVSAAGRRMCEDCCRIWNARIHEEDKHEAFEVMLKSWSIFSEFKDILEKTTGLSYSKIENEWYSVPVFTRIGSCYSGEQRPKVSIIIPVYNVENYLAECIESVINQSFRELEIICINDGSTDDSLMVLEGYAAQDDRITVISQRNQGLSVTRNVGLTYVHGEYVQFLDSDDMLERDTVEMLYACAQCEQLDVLFFGAEVIFENDQLKKKHNNYDNYYSSTKNYSKESGQRLFIKLWHDHVYRESACLQFLNTDFIKSNSLQFYPGIVHEDNLFTFKVCMLAGQAAKMNENFYLRRIREDSIMTTPSDFRNLYGYLKTYSQMMAFVEENALDPECEKDIIFYISQIKNRVSQYAESLPTIEMRKASQLSRWDKYWLYQIVDQAKRQKNTTDVEALEQRAALAEQYLDDVHHSVSFRIGRAITWFPRKVRGGVRCYKEHGMRYTVNRFLYHLGLRKE